MKKSVDTKNLLFSGLILLVTVASMYATVLKSGLQWSVEQRQFWVSMGELVLLFCLTAVIMHVLQNRKYMMWASIIVEILFFCFIHSYFYSILLGGIYAFGIYLLGKTVGRYTCSEKVQNDIIVCTITGIACEIILVGLLSLLRLGTPEKLRIVFAIIFIILLFWNRRSLAESCRKINSIPIHFRRLERFLLAGILTLFLLQAGRANISLDYDSVWYGLRSEYMLAPFHGIFDQVIALGCVYTYSKGIEILSLPFAGLSSLGMIYTVNLFLTIGIFFAVYRICRRNCSRTESLIVVLAVAATPGIMNMSVTAKSDISTLYLQIAAIYFGTKGMRDNEADWYVLSIFALLLSYAFKSSSWIFSSILLIIFIASFLKRKLPVRFNQVRIFLVALAAMVVVFGRTWYLSGCPANFFFPSIWNTLGLKIKYPYEFYTANINSVSELRNIAFLKERITRLLYIFFAPITGDTDHIIIAWGGVPFSIAVMAALSRIIFHPIQTFKKMMSDDLYKVSFISFLLIGVASVGGMILLLAPDGNYFVLFYTITYLFVSQEIFCKERTCTHYVFTTCLLLATGGLMCLLSSWGWSLGLTPVSIENHGYYDSQAWRKKYMESTGLTEIYNKLEKGEPKRVVLFSYNICEILMPAMIDTWHETACWGKSSTENEDTFREYMDFAGVECLLLNGEYLRTDSHARSVVEALVDDGYLRADIIDREYALVNVQRAAGAVDQTLVNYLDGLNFKIQYGISEDNWAEKTACLRLINEVPVTISLDAVYPRTATGNEKITIEIDGYEIDTYQIQDGQIQIQIPVNEPGTHEILLKSNFSFPADPPDVRTDLAYYVVSLNVEK